MNVIETLEQVENLLEELILSIYKDLADDNDPGWIPYGDVIELYSKTKRAISDRTP